MPAVRVNVAQPLLEDGVVSQLSVQETVRTPSTIWATVGAAVPTPNVRLPPVEDTGIVDAFLGQLEDNETRETAANTLFEFLRKTKRGRMVVTSLSVQRVLCRDDATLLIEQLGLFRSAFSQYELLMAIEGLFKSYNRARKNSSKTLMWLLRTVVRPEATFSCRHVHSRAFLWLCDLCRWTWPSCL